MTTLHWEVCDHCGHRFYPVGVYSVVVPNPNDLNHVELWCSTCTYMPQLVYYL